MGPHRDPAARVLGALLLALALGSAHPAAGAERTNPVARWLASLLPGGDDEPCELGDEVVGGRVEPGARDVVVPVRKKAWEAAHGGEAAAAPYVRARLAGWPTTALVDRAALPADDRAFVARLAADTWRGIAAFTDGENGLPVDNVRFGAAVARDDARVGDYTNVTSVGLHLLAIVAARELGLVSTDEAVTRLRRLLETLDGLERYQGFFFNYYDTTSRERTSNLVSFVDSSWLTAGLMVVRAAFPALAAPCTRLLDAQDYRFFYDPAAGRMSHGFWVQLGSRSRYHYGVLYAESRLGSVIAIGRGDVPEAHWFRMVRTFPPSCRWQRGTPEDRREKSVRGHTFRGGYYAWEGTRYVPSWGGSMFEALMPTLVVDEPRVAPRSLGANDVAHAAVQRRYATERLGLPVWGMSPASVPGTGGYGEFGVPFLGTLGYAPGAVTPHAAALALTVAPQAAIADLRALVARYDVYGEYGLYDAVDPRSGEVARAYLALDQAMTLVAAANYLTGGAVQRRFAADPAAAQAFAVLGDEDFFD